MQFKDSSAYEENLKTFLDKVEGEDAEMSAILRANFEKLATTTDGSQADRKKARTEFNRAVVEALDGLLADEGGDA